MATSRSLNKVMLIGNLTRDPIVRYTPTGSLVCTFGIATNSVWKSQDGQQKEKAEYHNIVAWNKLGEICSQLLSVGMLVYVEGELRTRISDVNGEKKYRTEVKIVDMKLLDNKGKSGVGIDKAKTLAEKESVDPVIVEDEPVVAHDDHPVTADDMPF